MAFLTIKTVCREEYCQADECHKKVRNLCFMYDKLYTGQEEITEIEPGLEI